MPVAPLPVAWFETTVGAREHREYLMLALLERARDVEAAVRELGYAREQLQAHDRHYTRDGEKRA